MSMYRLAMAVLVSSILSCADVTVRKLDCDSEYVEGVRFYRPAPYVAVYKELKDGNAAYRTQFLFLPSPDEEYVIEWKAGIGKITPNFTLSDGWNLTAFNSTVESGAAATLSSLSDLADSANGFRDMAEPPAGIPPGLYRLKAENGHWVVDQVPVLTFP